MSAWGIPVDRSIGSAEQVSGDKENPGAVAHSHTNRLIFMGKRWVVSSMAGNLVFEPINTYKLNRDKYKQENGRE